MRGYPGSGGALRGHVLEIWSVKIGQDARPEREGSWIVFSLSKASRSKFGTPTNRSPISVAPGSLHNSDREPRSPDARHH